MSLVPNSEMRQLSIKVLVTDKEKARFLWELLKGGFNQNTPACQEYGFLVCAMEDGDLFAERDILRRGMEKLDYRDMSAEDFLSQDRMSYGDEDEDEYPSYDYLAEEALNQADSAKDKWNTEVYKGAQQNLPIAGI